MMRALQAMGETPEDIDDLEALRSAEAMVARAKEPSTTAMAPIDEAWEVVAMQSRPGGQLALQDIAQALGSEGVAVGWDPFEPGEAVGFTPPQGAGRPFMLKVPASQVARTRELLTDMPPDGVKYAWGTDAPSRIAAKEAGAQSEFGFGPDTSKPIRVGDPALSDNQRMEQLAGGRGSRAGAVIVVVLVWIAIAIAIALSQRG
jgi:hypothetical protein